MVVDLTGEELDLILTCLTLAYPVLALQLLEIESANEILELSTKIEAFKERINVSR